MICFDLGTAVIPSLNSGFHPWSGGSGRPDRQDRPEPEMREVRLMGFHNISWDFIGFIGVLMVILTGFYWYFIGFHWI